MQANFMTAFNMVQDCADEESTHIPSDSANNMQFSCPSELVVMLTHLQAEVNLFKMTKVITKATTKVTRTLQMMQP